MRFSADGDVASKLPQHGLVSARKILSRDTE